MRSELVFLVAMLALAFLSMPVFAALPSRGEVNRLESPNRGSFVLGGFVRSWFYWFIGPLERLAFSLGVTPLALNLAGVLFGAAAGAALVGRHPAIAGWLVFLGGVADILDGRIARARQLASPRGAFLDSTLDRFAEVGVFAGLAVYFHDRPLVALSVALALGGSLLVSYTRARGESQGVVCKVGVMQRAERLLLVGFGAILDPGVSAAVGRPPGALLAWVVGVIAVGTLATAAYRTIWISARL